MSNLGGVADRARVWRRESPRPKQFEHSFDYCTRLHPTTDKNATTREASFVHPFYQRSTRSGSQSLSWADKPAK
jgi:hypothetical protein